MSLRPEAIGPVPEETVRVAHAAFPHGTTWMRLRDELGPIYRDATFAPLFSQRGRPAEAPWRLALISVMQYAERLSDRWAADEVRGRIDWKYALGLPLDDPGFDSTVLCEFRARLLAGSAELHLLDTLLTICRDRGWLHARGRQRTGSTHVLAAIRAHNRVETVRETLRHALNVLAELAPEWLLRHAEPDWAERYGRTWDDDRLPTSQAEWDEVVATVGADGLKLLTAAYAPMLRLSSAPSRPSRSYDGCGCRTTCLANLVSVGARRLTGSHPLINRHLREGRPPSAQASGPSLADWSQGMIALRPALNDYLTMRRALGYKLQRAEKLLAQFIGFVEASGSEHVTIDLALAWATLPAQGAMDWWSGRLTIVRGFASYLHTLDPTTEVPPTELLPARSHRAVPYLYSDEDVLVLMAAAHILRSPLRVLTYQTLIGLLAVTGMRIGEAIRLDRSDLDFDTGVLTIRMSKFGKSRELPLHGSTLEALQTYLQQRDQLYPRPTAPSLFISTAGTRLLYCGVHWSFLRLVRQAGLQRRSAVYRPRPHDLRHSFAVRTVLDAYRTDADVARRLPLLSTYLGHLHPSNTYWYLSAAPELLALAGQRHCKPNGSRPSPPAHCRHAVTARRRRYLRNRAVARPRERRDDADLPPRRLASQRTSPCAHAPTNNKAWPLPTLRLPAGLPVGPVIMPTFSAPSELGTGPVSA